MEIMQGNRMSGALIVLAVNSEKTKYMEIRRPRGKIANEHIKIGSNSNENMKTFKYLGT